MKKLLFRCHQIFSLLKFLLLKIFSSTFINKYKNYWLISERGDEARDNGYAFYKYLKKEHPEVKVKYVITKDSPDISKIDKEDIVYLNSIKHHKLYISSSYLISTHLYGYSPEFRVFSRLSRKTSFFNGRGKKIFLQHGITIANIPELYYKNTNLDLFIAGAYPEYLYINNTFGYPEGIVKYTGFARYDSLIKEESNYILYMPTWRKELFHTSSNEEFIQTDYYKNIINILNNEYLNKTLKDNNLKLLFYPHYEIQKFIDSFSSNENVIIASKDKYDISELLRNCKMLITDYSSVLFDVAYLKKPMAFYQYDYESFKSNHYNQGYFDYKRDGFGPVIDNSNDLIDYVDKVIKSNFKMDDEYLKKVNNTFTLNDNNNCKRIYEEIIKL